MPPRISDDLRERILVWYYRDNMTMQEIHEVSECSIGFVYNTICNYSDFGQVRKPFTDRLGRPCSLTDDDILFLHAILEANPSLYLDEMQEKLATICEVYVSLPTISRALSRVNLSCKTVTKAASERNEELQAAWEGMMAQYTDPDLFVALDESVVDDKTGQRKFRWSTVGLPCVRRMSFLRGVHYSILPALTTDGIIALDIFEGSVDMPTILLDASASKTQQDWRRNEPRRTWLTA